MFYFDGIHYTGILDTRAIVEENFDPMCHHLLDKANCIQVLVNSIGGQAWITIRRNEIVLKS